jgi:hypothetical protein
MLCQMPFQMHSFTGWALLSLLLPCSMSDPTPQQGGLHWLSEWAFGYGVGLAL